MLFIIFMILYLVFWFLDMILDWLLNEINCIYHGSIYAQLDWGNIYANPC